MFLQPNLLTQDLKQQDLSRSRDSRAPKEALSHCLSS